MSDHGFYLSACVVLWGIVIAWNIIPSYKAWAKIKKDINHHAS